MPDLIQRSVRTSQPQQAVGINWSNPLTRGLVDVIDMRGYPRSVILGTPATLFGASHKIGEPSGKGLCLDTTSSNAGVYFDRTDGAYASAIQSHVSLSECASTNGTYTGLFVSTDSGGSSFSFSLQYGDSTNFFIYTDGYYDIPVTSQLVNTGINLLALVSTGSSVQLYKNGAQIASANTSPVAKTTSRLTLFGEKNATSAYAVKGRYILHLLYGRELLAEEVSSLNSNVWQIFEDEEDYIWVPEVAGGTTSVSSDDAESYLVRSAALATDSEAYAIRGVVYLDSACAFTIRTEAQASSAVSYNVKAEAQASATSGYNVLGEVQGSSTAAYSVRSVVYGDSSPSYNVGLVAVSDGVATYTIRDSVVKDSAVSFSINSAALSDNSALFNIKALVSSDSASAYSMRTSAQQEVASAYLILSAGAVAASSSASYNIRGVASAQGGEAYNIRASSISSGVIGYSVRGEVGSQATSSYTVDSALLAVFASSACAYSVLSDGVWPLASDVRRGVSYGPTGNDYTGTLSVGTGSGGGMNVTLSEPRLVVKL